MGKIGMESSASDISRTVTATMLDIVRGQIGNCIWAFDCDLPIAPWVTLRGHVSIPLTVNISKTVASMTLDPIEVR